MTNRIKSAATLTWLNMIPNCLFSFTRGPKIAPRSILFGELESGCPTTRFASDETPPATYHISPESLCLCCLAPVAEGYHVAIVRMLHSLIAIRGHLAFLLRTSGEVHSLATHDSKSPTHPFDREKHAFFFPNAFPTATSCQADINLA